MRLRPSLPVILAAVCTVGAAATAHAHVVCTLVADADSRAELVRSGDCTSRVTPASTFKIAISLMGFDASILHDAHSPTLSYQHGDPDWGGNAWLQPTDPARWIRYSVVWYSQRVTRALGRERMQHYVDAFDFGNRDIGGDPRHPDGLTHAWIDSSLRISPLEQVRFIGKLVNGQLPVRPDAVAHTSEITEVCRLSGGWTVHGKTGSGFPSTPDGDDDHAHGRGWFVGWAERGGQHIVFARLTQDDQPGDVPAGLRARDAFLVELPHWLPPAATATRKAGR